jgi:regulatory protein
MDALRNKALQYLAKREHSRARLRDKLIDDGFEKDAVESVLDALAAENLQSDLRFAQNLLRNRKQAGYGPDRISYELAHYGIPEPIIKSIVDPNTRDWSLQIAALLERRFPDSAGKMIREKARFLANRGYTAEDISRVLNREKIYDDD